MEQFSSNFHLEVVWRELENRADGSFFLSWDWIGCWLAELEIVPTVLVTRTSTQVVGLAILTTRRTHRHRVMPVRAVHLNETGVPEHDVLFPEYNGILADRHYEQAVVAACFGFLAVTPQVDGRVWDEVHLRRMIAPEIGRRAGPLRVRRSERLSSAAVDLAAIRADGRPYLAHLSANTRRQIRRALGLYRERGPVTMTRAKSLVEANAMFAAAGALHQARWRARGEPGAYGSALFQRFHRTLIAHCWPRGTVELVQVAVGAEPIGYLYNFCHRGRIGYYFGGFRYEADNRLKPGLVAHVLCIEDHLAGGAASYDFMAGEGRYRTSLGSPGPDLVNLTLQRPRLRFVLEDGLRWGKRAVLNRGRRQTAAAAEPGAV